MKKFIPAATFCALFVIGCGGADKPAEESAVDTATETIVEEAVVEETAPAAEAAHDLVSGKAVYEANCQSCHGAGIMGAPKTGDNDAWSARIEQGMETLISKSITGFTGEKFMMPAKGGNPDLSDAEVGDAVAYMVSESSAE